MADYKHGDVVQVDPAHEGGWGGCFVLVTEPKSWGVQGFVQIPRGGAAFIRLPNEAIHFIGRAEWAPPNAWWVQCRCGGKGPNASHPDEAIRLWNRRPALEAVRREGMEAGFKLGRENAALAVKLRRYLLASRYDAYNCAMDATVADI